MRDSTQTRPEILALLHEYLPNEELNEYHLKMGLATDKRDPSAWQILWEKSFDLKHSGTEVYWTTNLLLLIKIMLCSKFHCQKVLS